MMHSNNKSSAKKAAVFWDIEQCQVPRGYDPYQVRQSIESALKDYLPFTISAIGNLKRVPPRVMVPIFSTGIHMKHVIDGSGDIMSEMFKWTRDNPPPATLILIADHEGLYVACEVIPLLRDRGYTILRVFGNLPKFSHNYYYQTFLWKHFFSGSEDTKQETTRKVVKERCSGTGWICKLCVDIDSDGPKAGESFESLISHFESLEHSFAEWFSVPRHVSCFDGVLTSKEWSRVPGNWPIKMKKQPKWLRLCEKEVLLHSQPKNASTMLKKQPKEFPEQLICEKPLCYQEVFLYSPPESDTTMLKKQPKYWKKVSTTVNKQSIAGSSNTSNLKTCIV